MRLWSRFRRQSSPDTGALPFEGRIYRTDAYHIDDGVDYRLPVMLPSTIAQQGQTAVDAFLVETGQVALTEDGRKGTYGSTFDAGRSGVYDGPVFMPTDDPLYEWNASTRRTVLTNTHAAYHRNPLAKRAVDLTAHFAVGKGHTVTTQNRQVQAVIDAFRANEENNVAEYDKTLLRDLQVDGELFIRFFSKDGQTVIVPLPPWQITDAVTEPGFFRRVKTWCFQSTPIRPGEPLAAKPQEDIPAAEILHVAINRHSYELRGRPDLFVILPWLRAYKDWLEDRVRQNKWRGALVWWVQIAARVAGTIANKAAQYRIPPTPGSVVVTSDQEKWQALTNSVNASDAGEDGRQIKLMAAVGVGLPEYMLADGENSNLASASAQQLPALWKFTDAQEIMKEQVWMPIYQRVIRAAAVDGSLPAEVVVEDSDGEPQVDANGLPTMVNAERAFQVEYYELQSDDPKTMAEAIALDMAGGLISVETARGRRGYDHREEQKRIGREASAKRDAAAQGMNYTFPPGVIPGENGQEKEAESVHG